MKAKKRICTVAFAMCVLFIICSVMFTFMPHIHRCAGDECCICENAKDYYKTLCVLACIFAFLAEDSIYLSPIGYTLFIPLICERTLVGRKVKLSD